MENQEMVFDTVTETSGTDQFFAHDKAATWCSNRIRQEVEKIKAKPGTKIVSFSHSITDDNRRGSGMMQYTASVIIGYERPAD